MDKWDKKDKEDECLSLVDAMLSPERVNFIFYDESKSTCEQFKEILDKMKVGKTNMCMPKTW